MRRPPLALGFAVGQAVVFVALAGVLGGRSWLLGGLLGAGALAQLVAAGGAWAGRPDVVRAGGVGGLLAAFATMAAFLQLGLHLVLTFGVGNREIGWQVIGGVFLASPWLIAVPLAQIARPARWLGVSAAAVVVIAGVPVAYGAVATHTYAAPPAATAATWLLDRVGPPPEGAGPYALVLVQDGVVVERAAGETGLAAALAAFPAVPRGAGVVVELALDEGPLWPIGLLGGAAVRPGDGLRGPAGWFGGVEVGDGLVDDALGVGVPIVGPAHADATGWVRTDAALADVDGVRPLRATWSVPPDLSAAALREAADRGAGMLAAYQRADGRFAYVVGADGRQGKGYQWTRHAGTAWYLAMSARRTGRPEVQRAARAALDRLDAEVKLTADGRAWVDDPLRKDGDAWIGNTALAFLAWEALGQNRERQAQLVAFLASTVGPTGQIRGVMRDHDETFHEQTDSSYAAGQGLLALIVAEQAGFPVKAELDRAAAWVDGAYWREPAVFTIDEHWMCIARAAARARGRRVGDRLCQGFLDEVELTVAFGDGATLGPSAAGLAAILEAEVAAWDVDRQDGRTSPWEARSRQLGRWMLANVYRPEDGPLLPDLRMVGGLRSTAWSRSVQIDAVQHASFAMLGLADRLDGR